MLDGRERDAIIQTPDLCFVIESTTSRRKDKVEFDARKTDTLVRKLKSQGVDARGMLVLLNEPTADQEAVAKQYKNTLSLKSFDEFLSRLFDAPGYLSIRPQQPFGSIQDPKTELYAFRAPEKLLRRYSH